MKIVICGSMDKNEKRMLELKNALLDRYPFMQVIVPNDVPHNHTHDPREKAQNRLFYTNAVGVCDVVIVCTYGHVGIGTALELGYAYALCKPIYFTHNPPENQEGDELRAMLADGSAKMLPGSMDSLDYEGVYLPEAEP